MEVQKHFTECRETTHKISEGALQSDGAKKYPVIIISQGMGNLVDRNYYTAEAVQSGVQVYEGKKAYFDHPTPEDMEQRPGRSVRETCGHYENCRAEKDESGLLVLKAFFVPEKGTGIADKLDHAIEYKKKYPQSDYIGISINGDGEGFEMDYDEIKGETIHAITKLTNAVSADIVTEAGAKGRILTESKKLTKTRRGKMFEAFKKLFRGLESNDTKLAEEAVKDMLQEEKKEEGADKELAKHVAACKKEMKKEEGESEEKFEARVIAAAKKEMEKAEKKEESADKKHEEPDGDEKEKKEKEEKKEEASEAFAKLKKENEELKKEIEALKKEGEKKEADAKKSAEESAKIKIQLVAKKRDELIDKVLAESGMRREITNLIRPVVEKCKTEEEIKDTAKRLAEAHSKAIESEFYSQSVGGFTEISTSESKETTDHLF
jgi:hypothetical protein